MKFVPFVTLLLAVASPAAAKPAPRHVPPPVELPPATVPAKPKLIVALSVDQFSADLFTEYRSRFTGGFKRLASGGVFPRGHQSHAATETCPGHSTILTGARPARTGIIANDWQNPKLERKDKDGKPTWDVYCVEAPGPAGSAAVPYVVSADTLKVPTLGDRLKAIDPATRVVAVSGKDRAAVMMGGHKADVTLWWDGKQFATYAGREGSIPAEVAAVNARATAQISAPTPVALPPQCARFNEKLALSDKLSVGTLPPLRKAGDVNAWKLTPQFDAITLDAALAAANALKLGRNSGTDLLAISFSATDYVGHGFGTQGAEMCTQLTRLDATLGRLFATLDATGIPYVVALTADHGGIDLPERNKLNAVPAERAEPALMARSAGAALAKKFSLSAPALNGRFTFGDMYIAASVPEDKRAEVLAAAVAYYKVHPQVAAVFTHDELKTSLAPLGPVDEWTLLDRARASFDPDRSGDFVVLLKPYVIPFPIAAPGIVSTHGSPWGYDRRVPILFWWKGMRGFEQPAAVETVDIMPTLASLVNLPVAATEIDGRCLDLVPGAASNCH